MIQERQLAKFGRQTKIMDIVDNLSVNDFYNVTGYKTSKLHGKMSRLKMSIVDVSKGKKDKANVGEFNFTTVEFQDLYKKVCTGISFIEKNPVKMHKANPHKVSNGYISVKTFQLTYESGMRSASKWRFEITTGKAKPNPDSDFGYNQKTYVEISKVFFLLDNNEMKELSYVNHFIELWENFYFAEFIMNRNLFKERLRNSNYNEENMDWNNNPKIKANLEVSNKKHSDFIENKNTQRNSNVEKPVQQKVKKNNSVIKEIKPKILCERCNCEIDENTFNRTKAIVNIGVCSKCLAKELSN